MSDEAGVSVATTATERVAYTFHVTAAFETLLSDRTATERAAFFIPHLRSGMRLLDCGSGPGSITCDLAEVVVPGGVVGLDVQPSLVDRACVLASEHGLGNVRIEVGSIDALPSPDGTFDACLVHKVPVHLGEPLAALREVRRVLKPGGLVGIRDTN